MSRPGLARQVIAAGACLFIIATGVVAEAAANGKGACPVSGRYTVGSPFPPTAAGWSLSGLTMSCLSADPNINGIWSGVSATAMSSTSQVGPSGCIVDQGTGHFVAGAAPATSVYGSITGGTFTYTRVGSHLHLTGNVVMSGGPVGGLPITAELEFAPDGTQNCVTGVTSGTVSGTAEIG